jgi:TolB protein
MRGGFVELFTMDAAGGNLQQVTRDTPAIGGRSDWSPDGSKIVFYAGPRGDRNIFLFDLATGRLDQLTDGGNNAGPSFSPDGQWIAFSSSRDGDHEIYVMRIDGSGLKRLTNNGYDDWQPRWGP